MGYLNNDGLNKVFTKLKLLIDAKADTNHTHAVDSSLSTTSTNPVQNKVVKAQIDALSDSIDAANTEIDKKMNKANPSGTGSFSLNRLSGSAVGSFSFTEGRDGKASGNYSHAEGYECVATAQSAHAEGTSSVASGISSHAEGHGTKAQGNHSHSEGNTTTAMGAYSHAEGIYNIARFEAQHVQGKYSVLDTSSDGVYAHIVGNGTSPTSCSNAHTLDWDGNAWFAGGVYVGGTKQTEGVELAKTSYVDEAVEGKANASHTHTKDDITSVNASAITGVINANNLPSYVDDVLEYANKSSFPATGESGKIYVDKANNLTYRWGGTDYVEISPSIALGETSSTAYRGDRGKEAYEHATSDNGTQLSAGLYKIATGAEGHVISGTSVSKADITALGIPAQDTTYSAATAATSGLMTSEMYTKLDGLENTVVENVLTSTSTTNALSAAQGKVLNDAVVDVNSSLTEVNETLDTKVPNTRTVNGKALSSNITLSKSDIGLGNVDNTADASKSVKSAGEWTTARTLTIGSNGKPVDGSENVSWTLSEIGAAASSHNHSASNITSGTLPIARGGTGGTTIASARNALGLGNTSGAVPVANGGTGATAKGSTLLSNIGITTGTSAAPSSGTAGTIYIQYSS